MKDKPRYRAHYGKGQPVGDDVMVEVYTSLGRILQDKAVEFEWGHELDFEPIIAYRILEDV